MNLHRWFEYGNAFFNWAMRKKKWVKENPFQQMDGIGSGKAKRRGTRITPAQEAALLGVAAEKNWPMLAARVMGALDLGIRRGEMLRMQSKHVNYKKWEITLPETKAGETQKAFAATPRIQQLLERRRFLGEDAYVFGTDEGKRISEDSFQRGWRKLFKAAGLPVGRVGGLTWHDLRHEYVSHLIDQGVKPTIAQKLARHKDLTTTMRYYEAHETELIAAAAKMAEGRGVG